MSIKNLLALVTLAATSYAATVKRVACPDGESSFHVLYINGMLIIRHYTGKNTATNGNLQQYIIYPKMLIVDVSRVLRFLLLER